MSTYEGSNPYASPAPSAPAGAETFSETARLLGETRPWLILFAVLAFIGAALLGIYTLISIPVAFMSPQPILGIVLVLFFGAMTAIYVLLGLFLVRFASAAGSFRRQPEITHLNAAMRAQKSFWKTLGIAFLVSIVLNILFAFVMLAFGMSAMQPGGPMGQDGVFEFEPGEFDAGEYEESEP